MVVDQVQQLMLGDSVVVEVADIKQLKDQDPVVKVEQDQLVTLMHLYMVEEIIVLLQQVLPHNQDLLPERLDGLTLVVAVVVVIMLLEMVDLVL